MKHKRKMLFAALCSAFLGAGCASNAGPAPGTPPPRSGWASALNAAVGMPGDDEFRVQTFEWHDADRNRPLPVKLYLPHSQAQKVPLIVVSHGIGGSREGYSYIGKYLAANGFACLHVQHAGSDRAVWFGNPLQMVTRLASAAQPDEAMARAKDVSVVIDRALAEPGIAPLIDRERMAIAGHSYGANTALLVSGAQVSQGEQTLNFTDARIKASVIISAPPFYGQGDMGGILGNINVPTLHITATGDDITIPGYRSGLDDRLNVFAAVAKKSNARKQLAVFKEGSHSMFTDRLNTGGIELNPKVKRATRELILQFLQAQFDSPRVSAANASLQAWATKHTEIIAQTKLQ